MIDVPRSKQFNDVYFSPQDGLAETRHVFLGGNGLPEFWRGSENFTICETGFGTGLNFLAVLKLWKEEAQGERPKDLHFISFEKYPLSGAEIKQYLSHWQELEKELEALLAVYPDVLDYGQCYVLDVIDGVRLSLIIGDVNEEMPKLEDGSLVDCWFLDGFKPSSNADMWSETVFSNMARLSVSGTRFATFTAAGFVRRGLGEQGFEVCKISGFGRKREMCVGVFEGI